MRRKLFGVNVLLLEKPADEGQRIVFVVDREVRRKSQVLCIAAEQSGEDGVERPRPYASGRPCIAERSDAMAKLIGSFVGERHRDDAFRRDAACDQVCHPRSQHARLAAPCTCDDQDRPFGRCHCLALLRVELIKDALDVAHSLLVR